jgi:aspartate-semialdehyde dehydrogenase
METIDVAVLGATGTVGQKFITLLEAIPTSEFESS